MKRRKPINTKKEVSKILEKIMPKERQPLPLLEKSKAVSEPVIEGKKPKRAKRPGEGRPAKTLKDLPKDWKETVILLAMQGYADVEIRTQLCVSNGAYVGNILHLWYKLKDKEAEFTETLNICRAFQEAWWIAASRKSINKQFFQHAAWMANMKNRFGWRDQVEINHGITDETFEKYKQLSVQDLQKRLEEIMPNRVAGLLT